MDENYFLLGDRFLAGGLRSWAFSCSSWAFAKCAKSFSSSFFLKNARYMIGRSPRVFSRKRKMNHSFCFAFPAFQSAMPFHTSSQRIATKNRVMSHMGG